MSDIVDFRRPEPLNGVAKFGDDAWLLKMCAEWRALRAQQQKNWAEHSLATAWGNLPDTHIELDTSPLERMQLLEGLLAQAKPRTVLLARELLGICVTVLSHEAPNSTLEGRESKVGANEGRGGVRAARPVRFLPD